MSALCFFYVLPKGSRKKNPPLMAGPLRGGWVKAGPLMKKVYFFYFVAFKK